MDDRPATMAAITVTMATTTVDLSTRRRRLNACPWLLAIYAFGPAALGEVEFAPYVSVGIARTDNLTLAPDGDEEAQTVYQLIPGFTLSQQGPRLSSEVAYDLEGYYYEQRSESESIHGHSSSFPLEINITANELSP